MSKFPALWPKWVQILVAPLVILSLNMLFHVLWGGPFHIQPVVKILGRICKFGEPYYAFTNRVIPYFLIVVLKLLFLLTIVKKYTTSFFQRLLLTSIAMDVLCLIVFYVNYNLGTVHFIRPLFSFSDEYKFSNDLIGNIYLIPAAILLVKVWWWRKMYGKVSEAPHSSASPAY
jgi:hypothetical protein